MPKFEYKTRFLVRKGSGRLLVTYTRSIRIVILVVKITKSIFRKTKWTIDPSIPSGSDTAFPLLDFHRLTAGFHLRTDCSSLSFFFFFLISFFCRYLHRLLLCGDKCDRLETFTPTWRMASLRFATFLEIWPAVTKLRALRNFNALRHLCRWQTWRRLSLQLQRSQVHCADMYGEGELTACVIAVARVRTSQSHRWSTADRLMAGLQISDPQRATTVKKPYTTQTYGFFALEIVVCNHPP